MNKNINFQIGTEETLLNCLDGLVCLEYLLRGIDQITEYARDVMKFISRQGQTNLAGLTIITFILFINLLLARYLYINIRAMDTLKKCKRLYLKTKESNITLENAVKLFFLIFGSFTAFTIFMNLAPMYSMNLISGFHILLQAFTEVSIVYGMYRLFNKFLTYFIIALTRTLDFITGVILFIFNFVLSSYIAMTTASYKIIEKTESVGVINDEEVKI